MKAVIHFYCCTLVGILIGVLSISCRPSSDELVNEPTSNADHSAEKKSMSDHSAAEGSMIHHSVEEGSMTNHSPGEGRMADPAAPKGGMTDHSAHRDMMQPSRYSRSSKVYTIPDITLTNHEGQSVLLRSELTKQGPVALNFIFTTCSTICPVQTATFNQLLKELGAEAENLNMISISIDPENDTPEVLKDYAERFQADTPNRQFLTGTVQQVITTLKAFDAFAGNKMNHRPLTFLRVPKNEQWVRIEGLASATDLAKEYRTLLQDD